MDIKAWLLHRIAQHFFVRPVRHISTAQMRTRLQTGGDVIAHTMMQAADTHAHQRVATHIIGIERWSQARLRDILTATPHTEEYDHYRPADAPMPQLAEIMRATRADTLALYAQLVDAGVVATQTARHNTFGDMSMLGWLQYLYLHGDLERRKLGK